jgi:UDPglucose--hexose-1-phosphate uridylyltransferase
VVIAPERAKRPGATREQLEPPSPEELELCPFCAGHEHMTPPQTLVLPEQGVWQVRVVPNLYPALERQEVVVHSRRHARSLAELEDAELELVAEAWRRRSEAHPGYVHALVNEGREAGSSLPHSHSQLVWLPEPLSPRGRPRAEAVLEQGGLVVTCPWASRLPYETVIAPAMPAGDGLASPLLGRALRLLAAVVSRLHVLEGPFPLNAWVEHDESDWRIVLLPRLTVLAGLELGAGIFVNTLPPEEAAARLRTGFAMSSGGSTGQFRRARGETTRPDGGAASGA